MLAKVQVNLLLNLPFNNINEMRDDIIDIEDSNKIIKETIMDGRNILDVDDIVVKKTMDLTDFQKKHKGGLYG